MDFFDYFQIIILVLFYSIFTIKTLHLRLSGIRPFSLGIGKKGLKALLEILFFIGLVIWTIEVIVHTLRLQFYIFPDFLYRRLFQILLLKLLGVCTIIIGMNIYISSLIAFGSSWRIGIDKQSPGRLVTSGIFNLTRNPIFLFIDFYFLGTWLIYSNLFFLIWMILAFIGLHVQILQEEKFLMAQYGDVYQDYIIKTRRYF